MQAEPALLDAGVAAPAVPDFDTPLQAVARRHRRVSLSLAGTLMGLYVVFMLLISYARPLLATLLPPGISLGLVLGAGMIVVSWLLACGYVVWANRYHDAACDQVSQ